jgi:hypothetical protein
MSRWWSLAQTLIWIIRRIEIPPQDAEQFCNSPELNPKIIEGALNALTRALFNAICGVVEGMPIVKARVLCGHRYVDLATLFQLPSPLESSALDALIYEIRQLIGQPGVEFNPIWGRTTWPASTSEAEAAPAPAADATLKPIKPAATEPVSVEPPATQAPWHTAQASVHTQSASEQPEATLPSLNEPRAKLVGLIAARATKIAQVVNASATPRAPAPVEPPPKGEKVARAEATRWAREPVIAVAKRLFPPDGRRPKGRSIAWLAERFNREPEFKKRT